MKKIGFFIVLQLCIMNYALCIGLSGTASVNLTSDTAAVAKKMALNDARRQIVGDALADVANAAAVRAAAADARNEDLENLIASVNIENERLSNTTYSADIKMTLSDAAAKKWLDSLGIENTIGLADAAAPDKIRIEINTPNGLRDWIKIRAALRDAGISDWMIKSIRGGNVAIEVPASKRPAVSRALSEFSVNW
jgi:hypothetical protein